MMIAAVSNKGSIDLEFSRSPPFMQGKRTQQQKQRSKKAILVIPTADPMAIMSL